MKSCFWIIAIAAVLGAVSSHPNQCKGKCTDYYPGDEAILLPHENCSVYCSCVGSKPVELPCPEGLEFSPEFHVCTWPEQAKCVPGMDWPILRNLVDENDKLCYGKCPAVDGAEVTLLEHEDCTKYCKCDNGIAYSKDCPAGLHFSPRLGICTWPYEARCPRAPVTEPPIVVTPEKPENCVGKCPVEDPEIVVHLAHKYCSKFCKCNMGLPYAFTCPAGLYFNPELLICDYPKNSGCKGIHQ